MERLPASSLRTLVSVTGAIAEFDDLDAFRAGISEQVRRLVPCDLASYNEIDPARGEAVVVADPADSLFDGGVDTLARYAHQNPLVAFYERAGVGDAVKFSDFISQRELHRLDLYAFLYCRLGIEHQLAIAVPGESGQIVGMALSRSRRDFTERDRELLDLLRPQLASAYRHLTARRRVAHALAAAEGVDGCLGVILLEPDAAVAFASEGAQRVLPELGSGLLSRRLRYWARAGNDRSATLELTTNCGPVRARYLDARRSGDHAAVVLAAAPGPTPAALNELGLTRRQSEVLGLVARGLTNVQVGHALTLSPRTVEKHLERAYARLGATNRTEAVAHVARLSGAFTERPGGGEMPRLLDLRDARS